MATRDLTLTPRSEEVRDKNPIATVVEFDLAEIKRHFDKNLESIRNQFIIAETLKTEGKIGECETIWRSQIVFLESALDYYIHEISKYGMLNIFSGHWVKTEKYNNFQVPMKYVDQGLNNPESSEWLLTYLNERFGTEVYLSYEAMKKQLNLLGLSFDSVMAQAFPKPSIPEESYRDGKTIVRELFERRNQIAHQSDRKHADASPNPINREYVECCVAEVLSIVNSIHTTATEKGRS